MPPNLVRPLIPRPEGWRKRVPFFKSGLKQLNPPAPFKAPLSISELPSYVDSLRESLDLPNEYPYLRDSNIYKYLRREVLPDMSFLRASHAVGLFPGMALDEVEAIACGQRRRRSRGKLRAA
ncbi:MAG: hypothetical protein ACFCBU_15570 [Cyanophyceae cyanobacterium]